MNDSGFLGRRETLRGPRTTAPHIQERPTWESWRQPITDAACLTQAGRAAVLQATRVIEKFLGPDWLERSVTKGAPLFGMDTFPGNRIPSVYARLLDIAAHMTLLRSAQGMSQLRKSLRSNPETINWRHGLLQLEVAGLALRGGRDIEFEPRHKVQGSADVRLTERTGQQIVVETVVMGTDLRYRLTSRAMNALTEIELRYGVSFAGETGRIEFEEGDLEGSAGRWTEGWADALTAAAAEVRETRVTVPVIGPTGGEIRISPGFESRQGTLTGPDLTSQVISRIQARIADKARAVGAFDRVWIRLDDIGPLFYLTPWANAPLGEKLASIEPILAAILSPYPAIAGLILSNGWAWLVPGIREERHSSSDGAVAIRRVIAIQCYRETFVKARDERAAGELAEIDGWYSGEATWLQWALDKLELPPLQDLINGPVRLTAAD